VAPAIIAIREPAVVAVITVLVLIPVQRNKLYLKIILSQVILKVMDNMQAENKRHTRLQKLKGSDYEIEDGQPDIRGWDVKDSSGKKWAT
jgi:hypothetical protein